MRKKVSFIVPVFFSPKDEEERTPGNAVKKAVRDAGYIFQRNALLTDYNVEKVVMESPNKVKILVDFVFPKDISKEDLHQVFSCNNRLHHYEWEEEIAAVGV